MLQPSVDRLGDGEARFDLRIGIGLGDVLNETTGDFDGPAFVDAARLCDAAEARQVLCTDLVSRAARAYANDPDILLMDEPFAALDVQTKAVMQEAVLDLWKSTGKTIVFVTHDLEEAVFLSDVVIVLSSRPGHVHSLLPITLGRPRTAVTRVSDEFARAKRELWEAMQDARSASGTPDRATRAAIHSH